jgi:uncharacterized GH25 family protein
MLTSRQTRVALLGFLLGLAPCLQAHEFWLKPIPSPQAVGDSVNLRLEVGEFFTGEPAGFSIPSARILRHYAPGQAVEDLRPFLPANAPEAEVALALDAPGTHLLVYDSAPQTITLNSDKFHAYLHDEGLDFVKIQREMAGTANQPGRERYQRHIKTLIAVEPVTETVPAPGSTYAIHAGQRLELTPLRNPLEMAPGERLPLKVMFDNRPLEGALVKAWHRQSSQLVTIRATTSNQGDVAFDLPFAGDWMLSVVHMIPAAEDATEGVDWDSFWGNLTFHMPARRSQK